MKTNKIMLRAMGSFHVEQRTCDGYFNATTLLKQWNNHSGQRKEIKEFLSNQNTQEFLEVLKEEINANGGNSPYLATRGNKGATWMHPYLFMKFAMWLNAKFELSVIKFVYDQLIEFRHSAGDNYIGLTSALAKFQNVNYAQVAKGLNYIVFGTHREGLRQTANSTQLKDLTNLQREFAFAIEMNLIKTYGEFIMKLREVYYRKYKSLAA